ncbi:MAG: hypothetical protein GF308_05650 [Candidatus Heimdallarchaeota archaeon]|nr:hypothetical protein [Candidatus Heimdallarchaeota archaeon]
MISKSKTIILILIMSFAMVLPIQALSLDLEEKENEKIMPLEQPNGIKSPEIKKMDESSIEQNLSVNAPPSTSINNGSWYYGGAISVGERHYYVLENVPVNSAKYMIQGFETAPASQNLDVYVKFGALPSTTSYDYKSTTSNQYEIIEVEVPKDDEYGNLYIMIYCFSGSGYEWVYAHYVSDTNGCYRSADYKTRPTYGSPTSLTGTVDSTDKNDFYQVYFYSGQMIQLDFEVTTVGSSYVDMYLYDEDYTQLAYDDWGNELDIDYNITIRYSGYYYIRFRNMDSQKHTYTGYIRDLNWDTNNHFDDAGLIYNGSGNMNVNDINDYFFLWVDSGEHISITITIDEPLDTPYYDAFLYAGTSTPINDQFVKYDAGGKTLTIDYYCGEYATSEISPGTQNKVYLQIWNAALDAGRPDVTSDYTISYTRSFDATNDQMSTAQPFTHWGNNDSVPKYDDLNGEADVNDWFKITTKKGYTINIAVNNTDPIGNPWLDGYLYDDSGNLLTLDSSFNITITYTASYTGDYYFRIYEAPAAYVYGSYVGPSAYSWYIYTSAYDGNDNFTTAQYVTPSAVIGSQVSSVDVDDFYQFEVPSGYQIELSGVSNPTDVHLYLYDQDEVELDADINSPWDIKYQHRGINTETYYARVYNQGGYDPASYNLNITLAKIDPDGEMADATALFISTGGNETGSDTIGGTDINDYYSFGGLSGDKILIRLTGPNGILGQLVEDDGFGNPVVLAGGQVSSGNPLILEYFPNNFYPGSNFYLRVYSPDGVPSGSYNFNITRIEFDVEDGYWTYSNELESGESVTINDSLSSTDTNDWYHFYLRSGERLDITLSSTMPDPHVGFILFIGFYSVTENTGQTLHTNYTNYDWARYEVWIQIVNEAKVPGDYTLEVDFTLIDIDDNGAPENAEELPLGSNQVDELELTDINDIYSTEVRSGYNLTVKFTATGFGGLPLYCIFLDEDGFAFTALASTTGSVTYTNPNLEAETIYVQFYNYAPLVYPGNESQCYGEYSWNATLVNDDPDGDFNKATPLTGPTTIINDQLFANTSFFDYNLSDINDFYEITLGQGDVLSLSITITGVSDPWFSVYIYDEEKNVVESATGADIYELIFNVGANAGLYYIRIYNTALDEGDYSMALSISTDTDSYFGGANPITPGPQTPDSMSDVDISDFFSIDLALGWRVKVNASLTGTSPDVDLLAYDPDQLSVVGDFVGTNYLEIEFTAEKAGTFYFEFVNNNGTLVDYDWWVDVYEDENGVFDTATPLGEGDLNDGVQPLDKFDYFNIEGIAGTSFTITANLPSGLDLKLYLYNSTQELIDADTSGPGLAITYVPSADETFFILFANPTGDSGDYSFSISGVGTPTEPTTPGSTPPTTGEPGFFSQELLGLPMWLWIAIGGGVLLLIIVIVIIAVAVSKKKKKSARIR